MSMQISQPGEQAVPVAAAAAPRPVQAAAAVVQQVTAAAAKPDAAQVKKAVENLRQATQSAAQNIEFSVDHDTNQTVIRVVDGSTKEVIRQIPTEEVIQIAKSLDRLSGLLLREKA